MRPILFIIIVLCSITASGQNETGTLTLNDGVYTSVFEIVDNNPKYEISGTDVNVNIWFGNKYFFIDQYGDQHNIQDSTILMVVFDGKKLVHYKKSYGEIIQFGAVTTFLTTVLVHTDMGTHAESDLHYWDLETGAMGRLSHKKAEPIIQRDSELYARYSSLKPGERKKTFYYYLLEYNKRNPL